MGLHVALIEPLIAPNTGNIARLCAATDTTLHLVEPLGFSVSDADVKRAGLDYWDAVELWVHPGTSLVTAMEFDTKLGGGIAEWSLELAKYGETFRIEPPEGVTTPESTSP